MLTKLRNQLFFWGGTIIIGWIIGRVILWNLLIVLFPRPLISYDYDPTGLLAYNAVEPYFAARTALVGLIVLIIQSMLGSFFLDRKYLSWRVAKGCLPRNERWLVLIVRGIRVALAGFMMAFWINTADYWYLLSPHSGQSSLWFDYAGALTQGILTLITVVAVSYIIVLEPWIVLLIGRQKDRNVSAKFFLACRGIVYLLLNLFLFIVSIPT